MGYAILRNPSRRSQYPYAMPLSTEVIDQAVHCLTSGDVIAYPTEAVWGLGCDPLNENAVLKLLQLKRREVEAGVLLVASDFSQLQPYVGELPGGLTANLQASWPGPVNWILPTSEHCPRWIHGSHSGVGVRVSAHPVIHELCKAFGGPLVSTSANQRGEPPAMTAEEASLVLNGKADFIVPGELGGRKNPCEIRSGFNGEILRQA